MLNFTLFKFIRSYFGMKKLEVYSFLIF